MSDDTNEIEAVNDGSNVSVPEGDRTADIVALMANVQALQGTVRDLERQLQQKQYELDISGGLARLNVASNILGGLYANSTALEMEYDDYGNHRAVNALEDIMAIEIAERVSEDLVSRFEQRMEKRAAEWAKQATAQHAEAANPAEREN